MSIMVTGEVEWPEKVEITLSFTMPLEDWETLAKNTADHYPGWDFKNVVEKAVNRIRNTVRLSFNNGREET